MYLSAEERAHQDAPPSSPSPRAERAKPPARQPSVPAPRAVLASPEPAPPLPAPEPEPLAPAAGPASPQLAFHHALLNFQFASQPELDGCLGPAAHAVSEPQPVRVFFQRQSPGNSFTVTRLAPLPADPAARSHSPAVLDCLERVMHGRAFSPPEPLPDERAGFEQVLTFLLPSPPQLP